MSSKWPKTFPSLTLEQEAIRDDFLKNWHEILASHQRYRLIEKFNHTYVTKFAPLTFLRTLEIGAGLGEHLEYESLTLEQQRNYVALELRQNMAERIKERYKEINVEVSDCQKTLSFADDYFDRIIAIHVLEHLPNLPAALKELYRVCNKKTGVLSIVIPCEGGWMYSLARRVSAQRIFERHYKQPYQWFIEREHVNQPHEIIEELAPYFQIKQKSFFPFKVPSINLNLCIGMTLVPS